MTPIKWNVETLSHCPSTQDAVRQKAEEGAPEGVVVQALMQTAGRGRQGNQWISPLGNLYMSMLLRPGCTASDAGQISFVAAVALSAAIDNYIAPDHAKTLKWPNDLLIDGRKCAGILLESNLDKAGRVESLVLGVGVNIMAPPEDRIGLRDVAAGQVAIHPFRDRVLSHFAAHYGHWRDHGFNDIRTRWLEQAQGLGQPVTVRLPGRETSGIFKDLDHKGSLILKKGDQEFDISSGEVYFDDNKEKTHE